VRSGAVAAGISILRRSVMIPLMVQVIGGVFRIVRFVVSTGLLVLACTEVLASPQVQVRLELYETTVLPGTPTGLAMEVVNLGDSPVVLPSGVWLTAELPAGEVVVLKSIGTAEEPGFRISPDDRSLAPGETRSFHFDVPPTMQLMIWLLDERLGQPGDYLLRAVISDTVDEAGRFDPLTSAVSNTARLTVEEPVGADAVVWQWMLEKAGGVWGWTSWNHYIGRLAQFALDNYPQSRYALFSAMSYPVRDLDLQNRLIEKVIDLHSDVSYAQSLRLGLAGRYQQQVNFETDLEVQQRKAARALEIATDLSENARSVNLRVHAARIMKSTPTPQELAERHKEKAQQ
jgi:hypothetical protein